MEIKSGTTTVIFSNAMGVGKTSLITAFVKYVLLHEGRSRLRKSCKKIEELNAKREKLLSLPTQAPIYANYDINIKTGYNKSFSPYWINPYYFGLPNQGKKVMAVVPWSFIVFQEMDDVYDSNNKSTLAAAVKGIYNRRRHWNLDIIIELHRSMNLAVAIRSIADSFIEVLGKTSKKDASGRTLSTTWKLRKFDSWQDVEQYLDASTYKKERRTLYKEFTFTNEGDIFKCYDSEQCAADFVPSEKEDFALLPQKVAADLSNLSPEIAALYDSNEPSDFRGSSKAKKDEKKDEKKETK